MVDLKRDRGATERIIVYSICIWKIGLTLLQLRKVKTMINSIGIMNLPSKANLDEIESALLMRRDEFNNTCKNLLLPLLKGHTFGHEKLQRYWLGQTEINEGYCLFEEVAGYTQKHQFIKTGRRYVLLLTDYTCSINGKFFAGELHDLEIVKNFLPNLKHFSKRKLGQRPSDVFDAVHKTIGLAINKK